jgi:Peptidase A4 family
MPRVRSARRRSQSAKRWWAVAAVVVSLSIGAGVLVANSNDSPQTQALQTSAWVRWQSGWGRGGYAMMSAPGQRATVNGTAAQLSPQARQRLSVKRESSQQFLAAYKRQHAQQYQYYLSHKRLLAQEYQALLKKWRHGHGGKPPVTATPTATPTASSTVTSTAAPTATATTTQTAAPTATPTGNSTVTSTATPTATATTASPTATATTASPTATATATPTTTATATTTPTVTPTASPTTTPVAGVTQVTSPNWAGYAATGAAGTFTSVAANWIVPPVACGGAARSSYAVGLDGEGTSTIEQIGTESDCNGDFELDSGWFQMAPNAPVFFKNPVKPGDAMTASVTALGGGAFMLTLFDMTQNWTQITQQTSAAATLGSAEIVAQDPVQDGQAQPLSNFGIVDFLGAAVNNAAIAAPVNEVTLVSAAGNTLAEPSNITGGAGNFAVGWDASA